MILRYRVSLNGIKGFSRVYELKSSMSLYDFHNLMQADMEFPQDQLIQFKGLSAHGALVARYAMFDLGYGTVDEVSLGMTVKKGVSVFNYFYDVTNKKYVIVSYEGEVEERIGASYPALVESKGPNPIEFENGYVAYEDLPEDQKRPPQPEASSAKNSLMALFGGGEDFYLSGNEEEEDREEDYDEDGEEIYDENEGAF